MGWLVLLIIVCALIYWRNELLDMFSLETMMHGENKPVTKAEKEKARIKEKNRKAIARSKGRGWKVEP